jgi:hypothetical protein
LCHSANVKVSEKKWEKKKEKEKSMNKGGKEEGKENERARGTCIFHSGGKRVT